MSAFPDMHPPAGNDPIDLSTEGGIHVSVQNASATDDGRVFAGLNVGQIVMAGESLRTQIVSWLSPIDHTLTQNTLTKDRSPETGDWFLETVRNWLRSTSRCMWVYGDVGCGKSTLCSNLLENYSSLFDDEDDARSQAVLYFYFTFRDTRTFELDTLYRSFIVQLCRHDVALAKIADVYEKNKPYQPSEKQLHDTLLSMLGSKPITIMLDGLDEIPPGRRRDACLEFVEEILQLQVICNRLVVFSRGEADIRECLQPSVGWHQVAIPLKNIEKDIGTYVDAEISSGRKLRRLDAVVKSRIRQSLTVHCKGMFRLAALQMSELAKMSSGLTPDAIDEVLRDLPKELDEYYDVIVKRLPTHVSQILRVAVQWLVFAARPMFIEEIVEACAIGKRKEETAVRYNLGSRLDALDICEYLSGLVALDPPLVDDVRLPPKAHTLTLAHFSVREYLSPLVDLHRPAGLWRLDAEQSQRLIAQSCLAYIHHCCSTIASTATESYPLKAYAWFFWAVHLCALDTRSPKAEVTPESLFLHNTVCFPILYASGDSRTAQKELNTARFRALADSVPIPEPTAEWLHALQDPTFPEELATSDLLWFSHIPLGSCPGVTRFVILEPSSDPTTLLSCNICTDAIYNRPSYTALTYTWGTEPETSNITLNGRLYSIRTNLMHALRQLRHPHEPRVLWIDALCISMQDSSERSAQIALMAHIYGCAEETVVWLGNEEDGSTAAMELLASEDIRERLNPNISGISTVDRNLGHLTHFLTRKLWHRSWSIQELVSARKATVYWGSDRLAWNAVINLDELRAYLQPLLFNDRVWYEESPEMVFHSGWDAVRAIQQLRHRKQAGQVISLPEVLYLARFHRASDYRDRVYALLSLVPESVQRDPRVRADYALSVEDMYMRVMSYLLQETKDLDLLSFVLCREKIDEIARIPGDWHLSSSLPSWIPCWSRYMITPLPIDRSLTRQPAIYSAGTKGLAKSQVPLEISSSLLRVTVSGFLVDTVRWCGNMDSINSMLYSTRADARTGESFPEKWYRTSWADQRIHTDGSISRLGPSTRQGFRRAHEEQQIRRTRDLDDQTRSMIMSEDHDYVGLAPYSVHLGDLIVVLLGASVPFILRPISPSLVTTSVQENGQTISLERPSEYALVGEAYIHGIMDGEVLDEWRSGERNVQEFNIF
ncbi:HET-domain-containing protein [Lophiostoma macrostomum CBS 122681]|uniref:HET-domain-containing protein n=1 Tax=Lophiostoma macrostomum CBS 122681 TaxID=1314788 RepID=A0A6A6STK0_9PLEO|nr:HET-domain-containing protein [Lophiostoma macrostomum CBS 122681]